MEVIFSAFKVEQTNDNFDNYSLESTIGKKYLHKMIMNDFEMKNRKADTRAYSVEY